MASINILNFKHHNYLNLLIRKLTNPSCTSHVMWVSIASLRRTRGTVCSPYSFVSSPCLPSPWIPLSLSWSPFSLSSLCPLFAHNWRPIYALAHTVLPIRLKKMRMWVYIYYLLIRWHPGPSCGFLQLGSVGTQKNDLKAWSTQNVGLDSRQCQVLNIGQGMNSMPKLQYVYNLLSNHVFMVRWHISHQDSKT